MVIKAASGRFPHIVAKPRQILKQHARLETGEPIQAVDRSRSTFHPVHRRIAGITPAFVGILHYEMDHGGYEFGQNLRPVADLITVDRALSCCAAVDQLIAECVEPVE